MQQAVRIIEQVLEFVAGGAKNFCGKICGGFYSGNRRILGNVTNLIYLDAGLACESGLKLFRQGRWFCVATWKRTNKTRELRLRKRWRKVNAGDTGSDQQLGKTFFASRSAERHTIEKNLIAGSAE